MKLEFFCGEINKNRKDFKPRLTMCKDENGDIISDKEGILNRWQRYFKNLLTNKTF